MPEKESPTMPAARFTPPSHWEDWLSWALGIWLCISPWVLRFNLEPTATHAAAITGGLLILVEAIALSAFSAWEEWLNVILGLWLIAAPWLIVAKGAATGNFVVIGIIVVALAIYEMRNPSPVESEDEAA
ncbi:MAG TPA: SPW repeat protein [Pseudolabrys sp.]|nr:SPW repeat protein [Pseudolabrys sp.]